MADNEQAKTDDQIVAFDIFAELLRDHSDALAKVSIDDIRGKEWELTLKVNNRDQKFSLSPFDIIALRGIWAELPQNIFNDFSVEEWRRNIPMPVWEMNGTYGKDLKYSLAFTRIEHSAGTDPAFLFVWHRILRPHQVPYPYPQVLKSLHAADWMGKPEKSRSLARAALESDAIQFQDLFLGIETNAKEQALGDAAIIWNSLSLSQRQANRPVYLQILRSIAHGTTLQSRAPAEIQLLDAAPHIESETDSDTLLALADGRSIVTVEPEQSATASAKLLPAPRTEVVVGNFPVTERERLRTSLVAEREARNFAERIEVETLEQVAESLGKARLAYALSASRLEKAQGESEGAKKELEEAKKELTQAREGRIASRVLGALGISMPLTIVLLIARSAIFDPSYNSTYAVSASNYQLSNVLPLNLKTADYPVSSEIKSQLNDVFKIAYTYLANQAQGIDYRKDIANNIIGQRMNKLTSLSGSRLIFDLQTLDLNPGANDAHMQAMAFTYSSAYGVQIEIVYTTGANFQRDNDFFSEISSFLDKKNCFSDFDKVKTFSNGTYCNGIKPFRVVTETSNFDNSDSTRASVPAAVNTALQRVFDNAMAQVKKDRDAGYPPSGIVKVYGNSPSDAPKP